MFHHANTPVAAGQLAIPAPLQDTGPDHRVPGEGTRRAVRQSGVQRDISQKKPRPWGRSSCSRRLSMLFDACGKVL